jgi:hypothetical protein
MSRALVGGLVALATVLAYPFGLRADEASAVAWVAKNRGKITRDDKLKDRPVVGVDLFNYQYNLMGKRVPDAELKELASFPNLEYLSLAFTKITDAGLKELASLQQLQELTLQETGITDAGLKELASLKALGRVYLHATKVTASGMAELKKALPDCDVSQVELE